MYLATLTSKGQLTLPKAIRERLALEQGDRLRVAISRDGRLTLERAQPASVDNVVGLLRHLARSRPVSVAEMRAAVRRRARAKARA